MYCTVPTTAPTIVWFADQRPLVLMLTSCTFVAPPQGLFGWLDVGADTERLAQAMHDEGWLLAPGTLFHATPRPTTLMRINFATSQEARFWRALHLSRGAL